MERNENKVIWNNLVSVLWSNRTLKIRIVKMGQSWNELYKAAQLYLHWRLYIFQLHSVIHITRCSKATEPTTNSFFSELGFYLTLVCIKSLHRYKELGFLKCLPILGDSFCEVYYSKKIFKKNFIFCYK